ncbi:hypothetical protein CPB85DRAFT_1441004 [Mucidula mucida]|nr:hypothetical protein CPB85DRAFT_1441004 [Mucidula mucida]
MAPQLPIELIDNIVDSHRYGEKKLLLSLLSAGRCFKRARRYLYQYVKIDFEPGADKSKPLDLFLFLDLLTFYGADIGRYVVRLDLRSVMLATKKRRALAALRDVISQLTALRDMDVHFEDDSNSRAADYKRVMPLLASSAVQSLLVDGSNEQVTIKGLTAANFRLLLSGMPNLRSLFVRQFSEYMLTDVVAFPDTHDILRLTLLDLPFMEEVSIDLAHLYYELSGPREVSVPWWWFDRYARNLMGRAHAVIVDMGEKIVNPPVHLAYHLDNHGRTEEIGFVFQGSFRRMLQTQFDRETWKDILFTAEHSKRSKLKSLCITLFCERERYEQRKQSMMDLQQRFEDIIEQVGPLEKLKLKCQIVVRDDMSALPVVSEDFLVPIISEE